MTLKFENMFADMYTKMMEANKKVMQDTVDATITPQLQELKNLKASLLSSNLKTSAPVNEVHCQVPEESASKKSSTSATASTTATASTANSSCKNAPTTSGPSKPPPEAHAPPGFKCPPQPNGHPKTSAAKSTKFSMPIGEGLRHRESYQESPGCF